MDSTNSNPNTRHELTLMNLPTELHIHIASYLDYPDALALKHTNRHFYAIVYTGVYLKVSWLLSRFEHKLECPRNEDCSLRTDASFCNKTVRKIMERRRRHLECRPGDGGCTVVLGASCRKEVVPRWLRKELRGWRDEVLIYGLLLVFWTLVWHAVRMYVR
ncbi:F-box domain protein [Talaromyces stipitatus ATCC 10500]|uniref:F-box domain protein n=1 Tax=Talaromyces stipitatus (strain ATCC 10500 / CBS 375.48 / QM 6759 / NRRL 1006) TaxID=441959 RepID=B8M3C9_TALSN|nr:F-box domain protein [Talaromyces stipitatus ATCC 10500]EED22301.1 F-box domain protein [Talaromyces stipitatus ATCC 10500]